MKDPNWFQEYPNLTQLKPIQANPDSKQEPKTKIIGGWHPFSPGPRVKDIPLVSMMMAMMNSIDFYDLQQ